MKRIAAFFLVVLMLCTSLPAMAGNTTNWVDFTVEIPTRIDLTKPLPEEYSVPFKYKAYVYARLYYPHAQWLTSEQGDAPKSEKRTFGTYELYPCRQSFHNENPRPGEFYGLFVYFLFYGGRFTLNKVTTNDGTKEHSFFHMKEANDTYYAPLIFGELNADGSLTEIFLYPDSDSLDGLDYLDDETEEELSVPQTGDSMPVALLLGAMLLSAVCAVIIVKRRRV